jgi:hypothetical protein
MAQFLHGSATYWTARTRAKFQNSTESVAALARRHGVNPKTVAKWRNRDGVEDMPMGPGQRKSTVLTPLEAAIVAFPVQTRLSLDDVFCALKPSIPALTRSTLHRCLKRHGVSRLPRPARERRGRFKSYEIGYFHIDVCEVRVKQGVSVRRGGSHLEVRLRPPVSQGHHPHGGGFLEGAPEGGALPDTHDLDRQRHPVLTAVFISVDPVARSRSARTIPPRPPR